jgi:hypothetical protein
MAEMAAEASAVGARMGRPVAIMVARQPGAQQMLFAGECRQLGHGNGCGIRDCRV